MSRGRNRGQRALIAQHTQLSYRGPLPPASEIERFEQVLPGAADRLLKMAEGNAGHRQHLEKTVVEGNVKAQARGQWFAFTLALLVLAVGCWLLIEGRATLGLWLMLADLVVLAGVFFTGRWFQHRERKERREELEGPARA